MLEQFSSAMLMAAIGIMAQDTLIDLGESYGFTVILPLACFFLLLGFVLPLFRCWGRTLMVLALLQMSLFRYIWLAMLV